MINISIAYYKKYLKKSIEMRMYFHTMISQQYF